MNWQRSIGLFLAGIGVVVLAFWFTRPQTRTVPTVPQAGAARPGGTNLAGVRGAVTNAPRGRAVTNVVVAGSRTNLAGRRGTNVVSSTAQTNAPGFAARFQQLQAHPAFYPVAVGVPLGVGILLLLLGSKTKKEEQVPGLTVRPVARSAKRKAVAAAVQQCNVLEIQPESRALWHFGVRGGRFNLSREQTKLEQIPGALVHKDWRTLYQRRLNVAWLPANQLFLRVVHLPQADLEETLSMVEFQMERLSPMPVTQVVWSVQAMPVSRENMQTMVVVIVSRSAVEEFLGKLESEGYQADRLEIPFLDQLQAAEVVEDGAWIYPGALGGKDTALVAWFSDGVLQNLGLVTASGEHQAESLRDQLVQMTWAGELEGWLKPSPAWRLVADGETSAIWEPALREALEQPIEVVPPLSRAQLAAATASRAAQGSAETNLLPAEYSNKYQQQFVDRLWMGALGALVLIYIAGVAIYMIAVQVALWKTRAVEAEVTNLGPTYTNAMQLKAQYQVLKDRQELKFAALDCWKAVAELLPESVNLEGYNFTDGKRLVLQGNAPMGQVQQIYKFEGDMRKVSVNGQPLFDPTKGESVSYRPAPGGASLSWSFILELKRSEVQ